MNNSQVVEYITEQLNAGHSESDLRSHMVNHGWSAEAVDDAFKRYHGHAPKAEPEKASASKPDISKDEPTAAPRRGGRHGLRRNSKNRVIVTVMVLAAIAGGAFFIIRHKSVQPAVPVVHRPTFQQRQSLDVVTLGGAVGQYVAINDRTLPVKVAPAPDGTNSVVLCGTTCDPSTWQVSSLSAYKPSGVKMVAYSGALTAQDPAILYLVAGSRCDKQGDDLSIEDIKPLSMAILYATKESDGAKQHCVIL